MPSNPSIWRTSHGADVGRRAGLFLLVGVGMLWASRPALAFASQPASVSVAVPAPTIVAGQLGGTAGIWVTELESATPSASGTIPARYYFVPAASVKRERQRTLLSSQVLSVIQEKRILDQFLERDLGAPTVSRQVEHRQDIRVHRLATGKLVRQVQRQVVLVTTKATPYVAMRIVKFETRTETTARNIYRVHAIVSWLDPATGKVESLAQDTFDGPILEKSYSPWVKGEAKLKQGAGQLVSRSERVLSALD